MEVLQDKKTEIRTIDVKGLCKLIGEEKVEVGERFKVIDKFSRHVETISDIRLGHCADTISIGINPNHVVVKRYFYSGGQGYFINVGTEDKGTKEYHKLLEE